jgi:radical SAM protein with 4Fe4S-binding SPASM domain
VITPVLLDHWVRYAVLIKKLRPAAWELFRPMTDKACKDVDFSRQTCNVLAKRLMVLRQEGVNAALGNAIPFCVLPEPKLAPEVMLGAGSDDGNSRLVWDVRGFFKPSYFIDEKLGDNIKTAWQHSFLKKLKGSSYLPQACRGCDHLKLCRCGSRALAFKSTGTYFDADPLFKSLPDSGKVRLKMA